MQGEMPPRWMWHLDHELEFWFQDVEQQRKEKFGSKDESNDDDGPSVDNEYAARFK